MFLSFLLWDLGQFLNDDRYRRVALEMSDEVFRDFYRPEWDLIVERVTLDGKAAPSPAGTAVLPGHAIEDMWFQMHIARERGDTARIARAVQLIRRHLEAGWDDEYGGLYLAIDAAGGKEVDWGFADSKLWWPHTEALYALLLAYEHCREPWCLEWVERVHDYSYSHYPVKEHGEWTQKLDRQGRPFTQTVALPVKDPFHLPRALIYCIDVLERLTGEGPVK
jgi:N-acylglucosamine 2-epimerase